MCCRGREGHRGGCTGASIEHAVTWSGKYQDHNRANGIEKFAYRDHAACVVLLTACSPPFYPSFSPS